MSRWRHVDWYPLNNSGTQWAAAYGTMHRGAVSRIGSRYVVRVAGKRRCIYGRTLREVAKHLVAFVNNMHPNRIR